MHDLDNALDIPKGHGSAWIGESVDCAIETRN